MEWAGQKVLVVGLGRSGVAAAKLLLDRGARVVCNDLRDRGALGAVAAELESAGAELSLGSHPTPLFTGVDRIIVSPGVPPMPALEAAQRAGVPIAGEVELASWFIDGSIVGITGTNGKSTVTSLVGAMFERTGRPTFIGGNLGTPLIDVVGDPAAAAGGTVVVELSSFQLERVDRLRVNIAALLNISEDHLDRYPEYAAYRAAKSNIFVGQRPDDAAVLPHGDQDCRAMQLGTATDHTFGGDGGQVRVIDGRIIDEGSALEFSVDRLRISGSHNVDNACAAALLARLGGVGPADVAAVLESFAGLPHRMQRIAEHDGIRYYDDSKATNVGAACASVDGLGAIDGRIVLIAGGRHKGSEYTPLARRMAELGRAVVLIGEAAPLLRAALEDVGCPVEDAGDMGAAVEIAGGLAQSGDVVLLSPACSSFDMFRSFGERGEAFAAAVAAFTGERAWD